MREQCPGFDEQALAGTILSRELQRADVNERLMQEDSDVRGRCHIIMSILTTSCKFFDEIVPSNKRVLDCHALHVQYPRLCHAVLFTAGLLVDKRSPLLDPRIPPTIMWVQAKFCPDASGVTQSELPLNNPQHLVFGKDFWLQRRLFEPLGGLALLAREWGVHCAKHRMSVLRHTSMQYPYAAEIPNMTLHEVCFYTVIEHANTTKRFFSLWECLKVSGRPAHFTLRRDLTPADIDDFYALFPPFFWNPDAGLLWSTRLGYKITRQGVSLDVTEQRLQPGDHFEDYRLCYCDKGPPRPSLGDDIHRYCRDEPLAPASGP